MTSEKTFLKEYGLKYIDAVAVFGFLAYQTIASKLIIENLPKIWQ